MKLVRLGLIGALAAVLALPAAAQTAQTSPGKPASPSISPVPGTAPVAPATRPATSPATRPSSSSALVDINSASPDDLDALPGIGKSRAEAIIKSRPYKGKDDLLSRHVLPPNIYKGIANKIIARQS